MGQYTTDANTTLHLEDGQVIGPGQVFVTAFRPEQEAQLLACGAITTPPVPETVTIAGVEVDVITGAAVIHESVAGNPGQKE